MPQTVKNATNLPMVYFKNGHDVGSCVIDDSSKIRIGLTKKYPRCPQQLFERPYLTVPYMGRGPGDMDLESQLVPGEATGSRKQCNTLSGITIPHQSDSSNRSFRTQCTESSTYCRLIIR